MVPARRVWLYIAGLLVMVVIVVAVVLHIRQERVSAALHGNHDAILADLVDLATKAQNYYRITANLKGGGRSFRSLTSIQFLTKYPTNAHGTFEILTCSDSSVTLQGTGVDRNEHDSLLQVRIVVTPDDISFQADNVEQALHPGNYPAYRAARAANEKFLDEEFERNQALVMQDLVTLGDRAQHYYRTPISLGGGGQSFRGLRYIQLLTPAPKNRNGTYVLTDFSDSIVTLQGTGVERNARGVFVQIKMLVKPDRLSVVPDSAYPAPTNADDVAKAGSEAAGAAHIATDGMAGHESLLYSMLELASKARQYYRRPLLMGGGQGSFKFLDIQKLGVGERQQRVGRFGITFVSDSSVLLEGRSHERTPDGGVLLIKMLVGSGGRDSVIFDGVER